MVDPWEKSKKPSSGNSGARSVPKRHSRKFYLDENLDCPEIKSELDKAGVSYRTYSQDVQANVGSPDFEFLPKVGHRGWILITADWHQRYRPREIADIERYKVCHFALPSGLGAVGMGKLLVDAKNDIWACCRDNVPPISANILRNGRIKLIRDAKGSLHERGEEKIYSKGKVTTRKPV